MSDGDRFDTMAKSLVEIQASNVDMSTDLLDSCTRDDLADRIASALRAAARVPKGHVRTSTGQEMKVIDHEFVCGEQHSWISVEGKYP